MSSEKIDVRLLQAQYEAVTKDLDRERERNGGPNEPPGGGEMDARVAALEKAIPDIRERLARVETKLDNVEKTMATKSDLEALQGTISADLHKVIGDSTWRFVQVAVVLAGLAFTAAKFVNP
ncbi:hypothetical protein HX866_11310 [Pseudomonas gingeri]|uniref:hypothetical protein n=1 Tax=Pseudomonas gingeri TaxID=117681 RepID=UPI00159FB6E3|nr:hypothetical protein [Pseudomonas gingeri]NWA25484.1 hypothetical protein [Pseudomonas gingeri]